MTNKHSEDKRTVAAAGTILLIDDDQTLLELLGDHLEAAGYQLLTAVDGPRGLALVAQA
jgi:two-component system response regulator ResD